MKARDLLIGSAWLYGAQLATVGSQFIYAAITSRAIDAAGFGSYAIALTVSSLISLLTSGGIAQSVARMTETSVSRLRALTTFAVLVGLAGAVVMLCTAQLWAALWGDPNSAQPIAWMSISVFTAPLLNLASSLLRRRGRFRPIALATAASNFVGMIVGAILASTTHSAVTLVVSPILGQLLACICCLTLAGTELVGFSRLGAVRADLAYSGQLTGVRVAEYFIGNAVRFATGRWIGPDALGYWNRADVVTSLPFQQVQGAIIQAVYPEFRHYISAPARARTVWTDLLILVAWVAIPLSAMAAAILPFLVPILFGPGWETSAQIVPVLAVAAGVTVLSTLLGSAVEVLGYFRAIWFATGVLIVLQLAAAAGLILVPSLFGATLAMLVTQVVRHGLHIWICGRAGFIDVGRLIRSYLLVTAVSTGVGFMAWGACSLITTPSLMVFGIMATVLTCIVASLVLYRFRVRLPPVSIARRYGVFKNPSEGS